MTPLVALVLSLFVSVAIPEQSGWTAAQFDADSRAMLTVLFDGDSVHGVVALTPLQQQELQQRVLGAAAKAGQDDLAQARAANEVIRSAYRRQVPNCNAPQLTLREAATCRSDEAVAKGE